MELPVRFAAADQLREGCGGLAEPPARRFTEGAGLPVRPVMQTARETAAKVRDLWPSHEPLRALPERIREAITAHMSTVPP